MTPEPPYSVSLNTDAPADPTYTLELAEAFAQAVRVLNHVTRDHAALGHPADADTLIREITTAVSRLPQLLGQVGTWLRDEQALGRIQVTGGDWEGNPAAAVVAALLRLDAAGAIAPDLQDALEMAASVTCDLAAVDTGEDGSDE